jgi:hypothetical protein
MSYLSKEDVEKAFQVLHDAWVNADNNRVTVVIPPALQHLQMHHWETLAQMLATLQEEQDNSPEQ